MPHTKESDRAVAIVGVIELVTIFWIGTIVCFAITNQAFKTQTYIVGAVGLIIVAGFSFWLYKTGRLQRKHSK